MKNLLLSILIITGFAACNSKTSLDSASRDIQLLSDSTVYSSSAFSDTAVTAKAEITHATIAKSPKVIVKAPKNIPTLSRVSAPVYTAPVSIPQTETPPIISTPATTASGTTVATGNTANSGNVATVPQVEQKKGWSKAAQGAAIGGVAGAVGGAILSKKKGLGAVVGGVVGAAGGYILGKGMDKKANQLVIQ